jgi:ATP-dependent Clp protease ATP-binding subunit ClpC
MFERFTDTARRTVVLAQEEARMLNHNYVGTEHLLLALTRDNGIAGQALTELGVTHELARGYIIELIGEGISPAPGHIPFLPAARTVLQSAAKIAIYNGDDHINPAHILHTLVRSDTSEVQVAGQAIIQCGAATSALLDLLEDKMTTPAPPAGTEPLFVLSA